MLNTVSASVVGLPVAPMNGAISASTSEPIVSRPLPPSTVKAIGARSTATTSPIRPARSATAPPSCPVKSWSSAALLLGRRAVVDEHDGLPRLRDEDVLGDVGRDGHRQAADVDAFDRALLDAPGDHGVAGLVVGVLADPARAQHVAGADLQQPSLDLVRHGSGPPALIVSRSFDRCRSVDRIYIRMDRCQDPFWTGRAVRSASIGGSASRAAMPRSRTSGDPS